MDLFVDDLNVAAKPLAQAATTIEAIPEATAPDAGASTGPITDLLGSLAAATATSATSTANSADLVQTSAANYTSTDQQFSSQFRGGR